MTAPVDVAAGVEREVSESHYTKITLSIAAAVGIGNLSYNFWSPFLPLFMLEIGAKDEANALFWIAIATTAQGIGRLVSGPLWGMWADRVGRKSMLLRCLVFASISNVITASIGAPWQLAFSFVLTGIFSGYVPASAALISVSVPDSRLNKSLSMVTSAQYLGNTIGPMAGAIMAIALGYRGSIYVASLFPLIAAASVLFMVPRDHAAVSETKDGSKQPVKLEPFRPTMQLGLAILVYFVIFTMTQAIRLLSPLKVDAIYTGDVDSIIGLTFTLGGLASAVSLLFIAPAFFKPGKLQRAIVVCSALSGLAMLSLALAGTVPFYIAGFALFQLVQAAMVPAANTLIAGNAPRARRGTAFGLASSAQAISFMIGPFSAAAFASISLDLGFVVLAGVLFATSVMLLFFLREPSLGGEPAPERR
jgi:DHA1 family multidrug resistance protein-like MFS transporter